MKMFVVLAGLMVIVPRVDKDGNWIELKVMVLDVHHDWMQLGEKDHHHVTAVTNLGGNYHAPLSGQWTITSTSTKPIERSGEDRYFFLKRNYPNDNIGAARPECYGSDSDLLQCTVLSKYKDPLVRAVLSFKGGWRIRPVEITHDREPRATRDDDTTWGFVRVPVGEALLGGQKKESLRLPRVTPDEIELAGGLILEPLEKGEIIFDPPRGQEVIGNLAELRPGVCTLFAGFTGRCAVVRFLNTMHAISYELGDQVQIDFTQDMMYDVFHYFDDPKAPRYLTFLRKDASADVMDFLYPGGGGTPFPRPCPPPAFAPEAAQ